MRSASAFTASLLASVASARIVGFAVPSTIAPGSTFDLTVIGENYIQSVQEISVAYGVASGPINAVPGTLGALLGSAYLGPDKSNLADNVTIQVTAPETLYKGDGFFNVALTSLYGARYSPLVQNYNATITVGDETSDEIVKTGAGY